MAAGITGLEGFKKQIDSLKKELRGKVAVKYRLFVTNMLYDLAVNTPQWSGDTAASWEVVVGKGGEAGEGSSPFKVTPWSDLRGSEKRMGDMEAVQFALQRNAANIEAIRYNSYVSIVNNNPTMDLLMSGQVHLRPENQGGGSGRPSFVMPAVLSFVQDKYTRQHVNLKLIS